MKSKLQDNESSSPVTLKSDATGVVKRLRRFKVTGKFVTIDAEDWDRVNELDWFLMKRDYVVCGTRSVGRVLLHRFILNYFGPLHVDHINHNPRDNRKSNLRVVPPHVNAANRAGPEKGNRSGYLGVAPSPWGWHAYKTVERKRYHLGYYDTALKAYRARRRWNVGDPLPRKPYRADNTSGCKGVTFQTTNGYWYASVQLEGRRYGLGCYKSKRHAIQARKLADQRLASGWKIVPSANPCGGNWSWSEPRDGYAVGAGCICHATRSGFRRIGVGKSGPGIITRRMRRAMDKEKAEKL